MAQNTQSSNWVFKFNLHKFYFKACWHWTCIQDKLIYKVSSIWAIYLSSRCKKTKSFQELYSLNPPSGLRHESIAELTLPQDPNLRFTTFKNSIFVQKTDISKPAWINACYVNKKIIFQLMNKSSVLNLIAT